MRNKKINGIYILLFAVLIILILCPLISVFSKAVIVDGRLDPYRTWTTVTDPENIQTVRNSLVLGVCVVILSTIIAAPTAYLLARTRLARHRWLNIVLMVPFMTPPYIASMGWILFMQKRGLFQQLFPSTGSWSEGFFSFGGLVLVMSLHVFLKTLSEYGTPYTLGRRIGYYVFTTDIHRYSTTAPIDFGRSASLSAVLVGICMLMWLIQNNITSRHGYRLVSGKGSRPARTVLSPAGLAVAWIWVGAVLFFAIGIPYFSIISTSLIKLRGYGLAAGNFTLDNYRELFSASKSLDAIGTSVFLSVAAATICSVLGTAIVITHAKGKAKKVLEGMSLLPEMLPGIVLVIGIMLFWNGIYKIAPLYNTLGIMVLAYVVLYLPYTAQYVTSAYSQINESLIQAGRTFSGTPSYVFRRITLPMIFKGIMAG